ncbi:hypothetical protein JCM8547_004283 [Rhodosporidiobolus lusitaniae]
MLALAVLPILAAASATALPNSLEKRAAPGRPGAVGFEYPPLRGWIQDTTSVEPCGGVALGGRINYPISGGDISLVLQRDAFDIQVSYSGSADPSSNSDFSPLIPVLEQSYSGSKCFSAPDFSSLGFSVGDVVTLQVNYLTGPKNSSLFQCADVTLMAAQGYVADTEFTCANVTSSTQTRSQGGSSSAAAEASGSSSSSRGSSSSSSSSNDEPVSPLGAGFIGAGVTIVVFALIAAGAVFAGFAKVGSRSKVKGAAAAQGEIPAYTRGDASSMVSRGSLQKA